MELKSLRLHCFRNYDALEAAFDPGVNLIVGDNAQGKTNLLEAIVYLSTGKAFRTRREKELIQFGKDFAELEQTVFSQNREQIIRAVLFAGRQRRQLYKNGVKLRTASQLHGICPPCCFARRIFWCSRPARRPDGGSSTMRSVSCGPILQLRWTSMEGFWRIKAGF